MDDAFRDSEGRACSNDSGRSLRTLAGSAGPGGLGKREGSLTYCRRPPLPDASSRWRPSAPACECGRAGSRPSCPGGRDPRPHGSSRAVITSCHAMPVALGRQASQRAGSPLLWRLGGRALVDGRTARHAQWAGICRREGPVAGSLDMDGNPRARAREDCCQAARAVGLKRRE